MSTHVFTGGGPVVEHSLSFLQNLFDDYHPRNFNIRLWDGTTWHAEESQPAQFTLVIKNPGALRKMFWRTNELTLAEAYIYDDIDIEGSIEAALTMGNYLLSSRRGPGEALRLGLQLLRLPSGGGPRLGRQAARLSGACHSKERDRQAVSYHYDVSNAFYSLWLDDRMTYSCAYFNRPNDDLDTAQRQKLDYLCRKLRLRKGDRLLDIGCGWGGLLIHAAQNYGVETKGITLSRKQAEFANDRIRDARLVPQCRVDICDYRDISDSRGFNKIVSVGMFEHVGAGLLQKYFRKAWSLLKPGGVFLNHGIAVNAAKPAASGPSFTERYVFPDGELMPLSSALREAELRGFEVRDVESLREHYVLTLRNWLQRLEQRSGEARCVVDDATYRIWRLFMAAYAGGFETGRLNIYQTLFVKTNNGESGLPLNRADWYEGLNHSERDRLRIGPLVAYY